MKSAFLKALHVASFTQAATAAQRRRELAQQQQPSSSSMLRPAPGNARPKAAQQKSNAAAHSVNTESQNPSALSSPPHNSTSTTVHEGGPLAFKKLLTAKRSVPDHSRLSSRETARADHHPEPLVHQPSTVAGSPESRHAFLPDRLLRARRPASVGRMPSAGSHADFSTASGSFMVDSPSNESAAADQESVVLARSSTNKAWPAGQAPEGYESGSIDSAVQRRSETAPDELWRAALSAADLQRPHEPEDAKCSTLLNRDATQGRQSSLTPNSMLSFAQADLTSSNDSSPTLSPRPPSIAIDAVLGRKARCAVAASSSPGLTPRLAVRSTDLGVGWFQSHKLGNDQGVERVKERCALFAARIASQASTETRGGSGETASMSKVSLQVCTAFCMVYVSPGVSDNYEMQRSGTVIIAVQGRLSA